MAENVIAAPDAIATRRAYISSANSSRPPS
jgi:hypothetical protein